MAWPVQPVIHAGNPDNPAFWHHGLTSKKVQRPHRRTAGPPVVCLGLAEGARAFCESKLRQDSKAHALSLSHLTYVTAIKVFHLRMDQPPFPCTPMVISGGCKFKMEDAERRSCRGQTGASGSRRSPVQGDAAGVHHDAASGQNCSEKRVKLSFQGSARNRIRQVKVKVKQKVNDLAVFSLPIWRIARRYPSQALGN